MDNGALTEAKGILVMGLNGCGKSTLGRALAERLGYRFMDAEDYYFPAGQDNPYAMSRTLEEALSLLRADVRRYPRFVYASVFGPRDEDIEVRCALAVVLRMEPRAMMGMPCMMKPQRMKKTAPGAATERML